MWCDDVYVFTYPWKCCLICRQWLQQIINALTYWMQIIQLNEICGHKIYIMTLKRTVHANDIGYVMCIYDPMYVHIWGGHFIIGSICFPAYMAYIKFGNVTPIFWWHNHFGKTMRWYFLSAFDGIFISTGKLPHQLIENTYLEYVKYTYTQKLTRTYVTRTFLYATTIKRHSKVRSSFYNPLFCFKNIFKFLNERGKFLAEHVSYTNQGVK